VNVRVKRRNGDRIDLPVGILAIFLVLFGTAVVNLFTKQVATIWGVSFTVGFLGIFVACEQLSHRLRRGAHREHLEQFNEKVTDAPTPASLGLRHPRPTLVAIRNPRSMQALRTLLAELDPESQDLVVTTCKVLPPMTPGITPEELRLDDLDREVLTRVVAVAEEAGKPVYPLVIPTNNPLFAIATAARALKAGQVVLGASQKSSAEVQVEQFAMAWGIATAESPGIAPLTVRVIGANEEVRHELE
jgi:nucleotide-binding universal stress UspA family protein